MVTTGCDSLHHCPHHILTDIQGCVKFMCSAAAALYSSSPFNLESGVRERSLPRCCTCSRVGHCCSMPLNDVQDLLEALVLVMQLKHKLLPVVAKLLAPCFIQIVDLGDCICASLSHLVPRGLILQVACLKAVAGLTVHNHLWATHDAACNTRCLHCQRLQQHIRKPFKKGRHGNDVASLDDVEGFLGELVYRHSVRDLHLLHLLLYLVLQLTLANHQKMDILSRIEQKLGCFEQNLLSLHGHETANAANNEAALGNGIPLLGLLCELRRSLEAIHVCAVVDGLDVS
mmetsp:Transcript_43264/g.101763  ORF Transcript_43264/g.101763 Transcript_43264/m.101763 type:complete len:287 (+) Transcript_43264:70-930(+)